MRSAGRFDSGSESLPFHSRCLEWLTSDDGRRTATRIAGRSGLPLDPFELLSEATVRILSRVDSDSDFFASDAYRATVPANYCSKMMKNFVVDLLRGVSRQRDAERLAAADVRNDHPATAVAELTEEERQSLADAAAESTDRIRVAIEYSGESPADVSAALTALNLEGDPDADIGDSPVPKAGAKPEQARMWPALWFAGLRDKAFPVSGRSTAAQQKYRSRKAKRIMAILKDIIDRCTNGGEEGQS